MLAISPLRPDDRERIGGHRLRGRIAETGRSVTYAAESETGEHGVLTLYEVDLDDPEAFLAGLEALHRLPPCYLVRVSDGGTLGGRPYVVEEQADGPTLAGEVRRDGPLSGTALHRFAIGTATALVALHEAGAVHGNLRPDTVILGPDGPRVAGTGLAPVLAASPASVTQDAEVLGTPTPEGLTGRPPEAASDMFAWGALVVFAATGRRPFEAGTPAADVDLVPHEEPDPSALDEPLRDLVRRCLAKDPADRPASAEALLALVGHCLLTTRLDPEAALPPAEPDDAASPVTTPEETPAAPSHDTQAASPPDTPAASPAEPPAVRTQDLPAATPRGRDVEPDDGATATGPADRAARHVGDDGRRRGLLPYALSLALAGVLIALVSAGGTYAVVSRTQAIPSPSAPPSVQVVPVAADPPTPPAPTARVPVPHARMTLLENSRDPVRLTGYRVGADTYVRAPGGSTFTRTDVKDADPLPSPDGAWLALATDRAVTLVDQRTGARFETRPEAPAPLEGATWSPDGRRLLLTAATKDVPTGFVLIDPSARTSTFVDTTDDLQGGEGPYAWLPGGSGVAVGHTTAAGHGVRFRDLGGREVRDLHWVGRSSGPRLFSPSGRRLVTSCPSGGTLCVWDATTGGRQASIAALFPGAALLGWYDDHHLIVLDPSGKHAHRVVVMDERGREQRVLAEIAPEDGADALLFTYTRS
ncbi:hypothetical protein GCM10009530_13150 [Microbispora corallina]|uniref:non-specific serine/threonine protein kinase n=1 Tax=Microbispora corallina TaxID=83302 RepID=A0ABQ4FT58_9ACTN|nr:protein kinase [Microbispora corallina]GIH37988.1 hypothetical protein Mco01_09880 [Microbispora corallina]